jgi:hypothetical protein
MAKPPTSKGFVYVLSNPSMPGMLKIGKTTRKPEQRVAELNGASGVPTPFRIEATVATNDVHSLEQRVHDILNAQRVNRNREFFETSVENAVFAAQQAAKSTKSRFTPRSAYIKKASRRRDVPLASAAAMTFLLYPTVAALHPYAGWAWLIACLSAATIGTPPILREYLSVLGRGFGAFHGAAIAVGAATLYPPVQQGIAAQLIVLSNAIIRNIATISQHGF